MGILAIYIKRCMTYVYFEIFFFYVYASFRIIFCGISFSCLVSAFNRVCFFLFWIEIHHWKYFYISELLLSIKHEYSSFEKSTIIEYIKLQSFRVKRREYSMFWHWKWKLFHKWDKILKNNHSLRRKYKGLIASAASVANRRERSEL